MKNVIKTVLKWLPILTIVFKALDEAMDSIPAAPGAVDAQSGN